LVRGGGCGRRAGSGVGATIASGRAPPEGAEAEGAKPAGTSRRETDDGESSYDEAGPLRRCIVTGDIRPKAELLRFVVGPDGAVVPDIAGRLPGRGLWLTARRDIVAAAIGKRLFGKAARASVTVPGDLAERIDGLLRDRCRDLVAMARRAGGAVAGFEKVRAALRNGEAAVVLAAADGGESGREKVRGVGRELPLVEVLSAAELGTAFGRDHVVHAALPPGRLTREVLAAAERLAAYRRAPAGLETGRRQDRRRRNKDSGTGTI
jgi:uncharacterized protein